MLNNFENKYIPVLEIFNFLEKEGVIKIDTILNKDKSGIIARVNGCITIDGYNNKLTGLKNSALAEYKNYLQIFSKKEQKECTGLLILKLHKMKKDSILNEEFVDKNGEIVTINKFANCQDDYGIFKDYEYHEKYSKIWLEVLETISMESEKLLQEINDNAISNINKSKIKSDAYQWLDINKDSTKIVKLYNGLRKDNFISEYSDASNFKAIFSGNAKERIIWTGEGGLTELLYLLFCLWGDKKGSTKYVYKPKQSFRNINNCFVCLGDKLNEKSIKSIYAKIKNGKNKTGYPSRYEQIDKIIDSLK